MSDAVLRFATVVEYADKRATVTLDGANVDIPTTGYMAGVGAVLQQGRTLIGLGMDESNVGGPTTNLAVIHSWSTGSTPASREVTDEHGRLWYRVHEGDSHAIRELVYRQVAGPHIAEDALSTSTLNLLAGAPVEGDELHGRAHRVLRIPADASVHYGRDLMNETPDWHAPSSEAVWRTPEDTAVTSEGNWATLLLGVASSRVVGYDPAAGIYPAGNRILTRVCPNLYGGEQTTWRDGVWHPRDYGYDTGVAGAGASIGLAYPYSGPTWIYCGHNGYQRMTALPISTPQGIGAPGQKRHGYGTGEPSIVYVHMAKGQPPSIYANTVTDKQGSLWDMAHAGDSAGASIGFSFRLMAGGSNLDFTDIGSRGWNQDIYNYGIVVSPVQTVVNDQEWGFAYGVSQQLSTTITRTNVGGGVYGYLEGWDTQVDIGWITGSSLPGPYGGSGIMPETLLAVGYGGFLFWAKPGVDVFVSEPAPGYTLTAGYTAPATAMLIRNAADEGGGYNVWWVKCPAYSSNLFQMRVSSDPPGHDRFPDHSSVNRDERLLFIG